MKKLSIISVCRNQKDIQDTIDSVIAQTFKDFEWIVIDGASDDGTLDKLKRVEEKIDILISEPDKGIYNAMNKGIKLAKGEYLLFLNGGDNLVSADILEKVFALNIDADVIYGNTNMVNPDNSFHHFWKVGVIRDEDYFIFGNISHQSSFIKRELFNKYGLYNEENKICSDAEGFLVFLKNGANFKKIELIVSNHKNDGVSSIDKKRCLIERKEMVKKYYSDKQIDNRIYKLVSFPQKIFSLNNMGSMKCLFIFGILFKFNRFR